MIDNIFSVYKIDHFFQYLNGISFCIAVFFNLEYVQKKKVTSACHEI